MRLTRACAALLLAFVLAACTTMHPITDDYQQHVRSEHPGRVWVTARGAGPVMLEGPRFVNDTLVGFVGGEYREFAPGDVSAVQVRKPAGGKTAVLVGVLAAAGVSLIAVLAGSGDPGRMPTPEDPPTSTRP
jgi:hypothetical protein